MPRVGDRLERDVPTCSLTDTIGTASERARAGGWTECVVINERRVVLGLLCERQLSAEPATCVEAVMICGPSTFRPSVSLDEMKEYFGKHDLASAPITTPDGVLLGLLRR